MDGIKKKSFEPFFRYKHFLDLKYRYYMYNEISPTTIEHDVNKIKNVLIIEFCLTIFIKIKNKVARKK